MTVLDWLFLLGLLISVGLGVWRGFVYEVLSVLNWLLALVLAQWLGEDVGRLLPIDSQSESLIYIAGFVLVFVVSVFVGGVVVWGLPKLIEQAGLRPVDRVLGGAFGFLRAVLLMLALAVLVQMSTLKTHDWWRDSLAADTAVWGLKKLKPLLPASAKKYVP